MGPSNPRQRLIIIYAGIILVTVVLLLYHFFSVNRTRRWLPERTGKALIVGKQVLEAPGGAARYLLEVKVFVPPASSEEAQYVPDDVPDRDEVLGAHEYVETVETPREDWEAVEEGARLDASYQITLLRDRIMIRSLSLGTAQGPSELTVEDVELSPE